MGHPDQKYIEALLTNDKVLLEELYKKYSGKIKWMVLQNNGTETDAADIFQDALLSIYNKAKTHGFILTCPLDAFLYLVCKNKWLNKLSQKKDHRVTTIDDDGYNIGEDSFKLAEECVLQQDRLKLLTEKLEQMGDTCKQLLHLSWRSESMEEVAQILQISYGYARKKKSECMAKLIMMMKESPEYNSLKW